MLLGIAGEAVFTFPTETDGDDFAIADCCVDEFCEAVLKLLSFVNLVGGGKEEGGRRI